VWQVVAIFVRAKDKKAGHETIFSQTTDEEAFFEIKWKKYA